MCFNACLIRACIAWPARHGQPFLLLCILGMLCMVTPTRASACKGGRLLGVRLPTCRRPALSAMPRQPAPSRCHALAPVSVLESSSNSPILRPSVIARLFTLQLWRPLLRRPQLPSLLAKRLPAYALFTAFHCRRCGQMEQGIPPASDCLQPDCLENKELLGYCSPFVKPKCT